MAMNITLPNVDPLQDSLQYLSRQPMGRFCRLAILNSFWNPSSPFLESRKVPVDTYFEYFEEQCQVALHNWERYDISTLKFCHLVELAGMIREGKSRGELDAHLKSELDGHCQEISEEIIDLTVRLLLMIQIGGFRQALMLGQERISWGDGPLAETLKEHFNCDIVLKESVELDNTFTARNIERIGGIRIVWTANLVDHLRMRDDKSVAIFHHASFLHYQQDWYVLRKSRFDLIKFRVSNHWTISQLTKSDSDIFPEGLVQETLRTLSLLLPVDQTDTKNWFLKKQIELHLDSEAARCRPLTTDERKIDKFE